MPVINMGLHAGMGLAYQLESVSPYIKAGDYVFIVPEYDNFSGCLGGWETLMIVCDVCPEERWKLDARQLWHLFGYMPSYGMAKVRRLIKSFAKRISGGAERKNEWAYLYNEYGDMTNSWFDVRSKPLKAGTGMSADTLTEDCCTRIRRFIEAHPDACVYLLPPALHDLSFENNAEYIRAIEKMLARNRMPFIARPERYKMKGDEIWDACYHLNGPGVSARTRRIIEDIESIVDKDFTTQ